MTHPLSPSDKKRRQRKHLARPYAKNVKERGEKEEEEDVPFWAEEFIDTGGSIDVEYEPPLHTKTTTTAKVDTKDGTASSHTEVKIERRKAMKDDDDDTLIKKEDAPILNDDSCQEVAPSSSSNNNNQNHTKTETGAGKKSKKSARAKHIGNDWLLSSSDVIIESSSSSSGIELNEVFQAIGGGVDDNTHHGWLSLSASASSLSSSSSSSSYLFVESITLSTSAPMTTLVITRVVGSVFVILASIIILQRRRIRKRISETMSEDEKKAEEENVKECLKHSPKNANARNDDTQPNLSTMREEEHQQEKRSNDNDDGTDNETEDVFRPQQLFLDEDETEVNNENRGQTSSSSILSFASSSSSSTSPHYDIIDLTQQQAEPLPPPNSPSLTNESSSSSSSPPPTMVLPQSPVISRTEASSTFFPNIQQQEQQQQDQNVPSIFLDSSTAVNQTSDAIAPSSNYFSNETNITTTPYYSPNRKRKRDDNDVIMATTTTAVVTTPLQSPKRNYTATATHNDEISDNNLLLSTPVRSKSNIVVPQTPMTTITVSEYKEQVQSISKVIESTGLDRTESCRMANEITLKRLESDIVRSHQQELEMWRFELDEKRRLQDQKEASQRHEEVIDLLNSNRECSFEDKICKAYNKCKDSCWKLVLGSQFAKCLFMSSIIRISHENWELVKRLVDSLSHGNGSLLKEALYMCKNEICGCTNDSILHTEGSQSVSSYVYGTISLLSYRTFDFLSPVMAPGWIFDGIDTLSSASCLGACFLSWGFSILAVYLIHQVLALFRLPALCHQLVNAIAVLPILLNSWFVSLLCKMGCTNLLIALTSALVLHKYESQRIKSCQEAKHVMSLEECNVTLSAYDNIISRACSTSWVATVVIGLGLIK